MLSTIIGIVAGLGIDAALMSGLSGYSGQAARDKAQDKLRQVVNENPVLKDMNIQEMIDQAYYMGKITQEDKTKYLKMLKNLDTDHKWWEAATDWLGKDTEEIARLYGVLTEVAPNIATVLNNTVGFDIKGALAANIPAIQNAPSPGYFNVDFDNPWINKEADPLKWWTGKELAEHNNLPYDVDEWYDAIKQGTEANVARDRYTSEQLKWDAVKDRPWEQAAYLSSISDTKGEAVAKGATAGAQAANQVLNMLGSNQASVQTQAETANNRWNTMQESLLADAQARLNANQKYQNLGLNIASAIEGLYENDVIRRQGELEAFAGLASADELLRNARLQANADMSSAYNSAQAEIDSARQGINDINNRFAWMWDRYYGVAKEQGKSDLLSRAYANRSMSNWIFQQATGTQNTTNYLDYLANNF